VKPSNHFFDLVGLAMRWGVHQGDLLDVPADVLICSANVYLALSGGVGGAFLLRYGAAMQDALQEYLSGRRIRHVEQGDVVPMPPCGSPYRAVLHAVAVDGAYESSPAVVAAVLAESLRQAAALGARTVALTAVATGYGRMSIPDFAVGLRRVVGESFPPLERVTIGFRSPHDIEELLALLPELEAVENYPGEG
jgi:O-acetyl-ADP-ribose deacetylase (regulator of RNase III)